MVISWWIEALFFAAVAGNLAGWVHSSILIWRYHRGLRQLRDAQLVLHVLCVQAFQLRHAPIWQAWANVMGNIAVTVESAQFPWDREL